MATSVQEVMEDGNTLILGSSGFIGSRLAETLLNNGPVLGYSRGTPEVLCNHPNYTHITGDFVQERNFSDLFAQHQISCVYHCISTTSPRVGTSHVISEVEENLLPTLRMLEAAANSGVERIIFTSSGGTVYGEQGPVLSHKESDHLLPICSYGAQKTSIEAFLNVYRHVHKMKILVARVSNPYGFDARKNRSQGIIPIFLRALSEGRGISLFGDTVRDYIHIDDVIDAMVKLSCYEGHGCIFNIGSGKGVSLHCLVRLIERLAQKEFISIQHQQIRDCDVDANILDVDYTQQELCWNPKIDLESGILDLIHQIGI